MRPLCVDLDGTLVKSDTLAECVVAMLHRNPARLALLPLWLSRGRAYLKERAAGAAGLNVAALPYNPAIVMLLEREKSAGRKIVLATGASRKVAQRVADHLGLFDEVLASDAQMNLTGESKARLLVERFGAKGFDYIGDSRADIRVWREAAEAIPANRGARKYAGGAIPPVSDSDTSLFPALLRLLRVHQWTKNLLIFVPIAAAHNWRDAAGFWHTALGFAALCLCASAGYISNDLADLEADRAHPFKRRRPLAAGDFPLVLAACLLPLLAVAGFGFGLAAGPRFAVSLLVYLAVTTAYSARLKRVAILDVLTLAGLYVVRIVGGGLTAGVVLSPWLIAFSMFLFLSIALAKRCAELRNAEDAQDFESRRRGYSPADFDQLARFGTSSAYLSALVLALYIHAAETGVLYKRPLWLWGLVPLMIYWTNRVWLEVSRGKMHEDPVLFALRDKASWVTVFAAAIVLLLA